MGNCVGLYNYRYFYFYLVFHCIAVLGFIITCSKYLHRAGFDWITVLDMVYVGIFIIPGLGMLYFHTQLTLNNLTTNEQSNLWRYKYLQDEGGRYNNPFDKGKLNNFYTRIVSPGKATYTLEDEVVGGNGKQGGEDDTKDGDRLLNVV